MKLSKVQNVLDNFDLDPLGEYNVQELDPNRVPNPEDSPSRNCEVNLLCNKGKLTLKPGEKTLDFMDLPKLKGLEVIITQRNEVKKLLLIN